MLISLCGYSQSYSLSDKDTCIWPKIQLWKPEKVSAIFYENKDKKEFVVKELSSGIILFTYNYNLAILKWYIYRNEKLISVDEKYY